MHTKVQLGLDCEVEDLIAFGYQGLLQARTRFDPARGVPFKSFAYYRVHGALMDGVRQMAYLPRRAHARMRIAEGLARESEIMTAAGAATRDSASLEGKLRAVDGVLGRIAAAYVVACASPELVQGEAVERSTPEDAALQRERDARVRQAVQTLPEKERALVEGHYLKGRPFEEIARELGLSKSWASRLHTRALDLLKEALAPIG
jgi:RNA polymerase sigma factor for flagellar operon FliA